MNISKYFTVESCNVEDAYRAGSSDYDEIIRPRMTIFFVVDWFSFKERPFHYIDCDNRIGCTSHCFVIGFNRFGLKFQINRKFFKWIKTGENRFKRPIYKEVELR